MDRNELRRTVQYAVSEVLKLFKVENCEVGGDKW